MTNRHPITPLPELVEEWRTDYMGRGHAFTDVAKEIAQWGADQELEACCEVLTDKCFVGQATLLSEWRRPKPPSLKEQALDSFKFIGSCHPITGPDWETIRRALEALGD